MEGFDAGIFAWIGAALAFLSAVVTNLSAIGKPFGNILKRATERREDHTMLSEIVDHTRALAKDTSGLKTHIDRLSKRVDENESDRLAEVMFRYGNIVRRGGSVTSEEYRYIQKAYDKYSAVLKKNGIVKEEYEYIKAHFDGGE